MAKNIRIEHIEEEIFNHGLAGVSKILFFLEYFESTLSGNSKSSVKVATKWDGAPAIFMGECPETNKFFVGTKSIFNKKNPKINYTVEDIRRNYPESPDLQRRLSVAFTEGQKLGIEGVVQGDMLYIKDDLKAERVKGEVCVTFQPNTILYTIPKRSKLARKILQTEMGVVFHTKYRGESISSLEIVPGAAVDGLREVSSVWVNKQTYMDFSGTVTLTEDLSKSLRTSIELIKIYAQQVNKEVFESIILDKDIQKSIKIFNNQMVREGRRISNGDKHLKRLSQYIINRFERDLKSLEPKSQYESEEEKKKHELLIQHSLSNRADKVDKLLSRLKKNKNDLIIAFEIYNLVVDAKMLILDQLKKISEIRTFVRTSTGFRVVGAEGLVAIDSDSGNTVKLVDRLDFSRENFRRNRHGFSKKR